MIFLEFVASDLRNICKRERIRVKMKRDKDFKHLAQSLSNNMEAAVTVITGSG